MQDVKKLDPFKPQQPAIPGVPTAVADPEIATPPAAEPPRPPQPHARPQPPPPVKSALLWVVLAAAGSLIMAGALIYWAKGFIGRPQAHAAAATRTAIASAGADAKPDNARKEAVGPGPIATTAELAKPWSSKRFLMRDPLGGPNMDPAIVVRLPGGQYWGLSLREPFGDCELQYVTDLKQIATVYGFQADHPMVVNPCSRTVYDLARYGSGALNGGIVRGEIVQGSGIRPPMAIEIRTDGNNVIAVRSE